MATPLLGTESAANAIQRVHWNHDHVIDMMISRPGATQNELAKYFGYSPNWLSRVICSDAFQARLAVRREELTDPLITQSFEERVKGAAVSSLHIVQEELDHVANLPPGHVLRRDFGMKALELTSKALGMGARDRASGPTNVTFVALLPEKAPDQQAWVTEARERAAANSVNVLDVSSKEISNAAS